MQIYVNEIEPCKLQIQYHADVEQVNNKKAEVLNTFKRAPVPGYRPGKANLNAIKMYYKTQIDESLKRALAEEAYHNTLFEKSLKPHGTPSFTSLFLIDNKFSCEFQLHTKPAFELSQYKNLEIPKPVETESASHVSEKMLEELRHRFGEVTPYSEDDFVQLGDKIIVDYQGFLDDKLVDNLVAEGEMLTVGKNSLPDFDTNLLGMKIGDTREFSIKVPEDGLPSLAGKVINFRLIVNMGSKTTPCALDDNLAAKLGKKDFAELRDFVLGSAQAQLANKQRLALTESVAKRLVQDNQFTVPSWMAVSEARYIAQSAKINWETLSVQDRDKYVEMANSNVKLSLILDKIRESEPDAQLTDQEVFDIVKRNLPTQQASVDDILQQMSKTGYLQVLFTRIKDEHVLDFVVKSTKFVE